ncbi:hypothetical protein MRX96_053193, partial [Rhipicephalus microplus]
PTCFGIFLYSFMTELAAGNMAHLKHYILTLKHSDHDDPAESVRQIRDLYFHQASSAQEPRLGVQRPRAALAFPLYCVYVGITMAASDLHDGTMEVLTQIEAFTAILGKRYPLQHATYFLADMCITSVGLNPPAPDRGPPVPHPPRASRRPRTAVCRRGLNCCADGTK